MTGGGASPAPHCFFSLHSPSKNIFFLTEALNSETLVSYLLRVPCSLFPFFVKSKDVINRVFT